MEEIPKPRMKGGKDLKTYERDAKRKQRAEEKAEKVFTAAKAAKSAFAPKENETTTEDARLALESVLRDPLPANLEAIIKKAQHYSRSKNVPFTNSFILNGPNTEVGRRLSDIVDDYVPGETYYRRTLAALHMFDAGLEDINFDQFLAERRLYKTDAHALGIAYGKRFGDIHREWRDFLPRFLNIDALKPGFDQNDLNDFLDAASGDRTKDFAIFASRNEWKSTFVQAWAASAILATSGSIRVLLISAGHALSKRFMTDVRGYFELTPNGRPKNRVQHLFFEHMITQGSGSDSTFEDPVASLGLNAPTASQNSLGSATEGLRGEVIIYDDVLGKKNAGSDELAKKSANDFAMAQKLRSSTGMSVIVGTPFWPTDAYARMMFDADTDVEQGRQPYLKYRRDPAYRVKPEFKHLVPKFPEGFEKLKEEHVDLTFPSYLTWEFIQRELRRDPKNFVSQNLVEWPKGEGEEFRVTFTEDDLRAHIRREQAFIGAQLIETVTVCDPAFSVSRYADPSCVLTARIMRWEGRVIAFVTNVVLQRMKVSDLCREIVVACNKYQSNRLVIESSTHNDEIQSNLRREAGLRGFILPHVALKPTNNGTGPNQKARRVKMIEPLLASGRLWFAFNSTKWIDEFIEQMVNFDGIHMARRNDAPDTLGMLLEVTPMLRSPDERIKNPNQSAFEREMEMEVHRKRQYDAIFGTNAVQPPQVIPIDASKPSISGRFSQIQRAQAQVIRDRYKR